MAAEPPERGTELANLVIVESPAKAKTIKGYLGKNYKVTASKGHVRDLPKSTLGVDIENDFTPKYINIRGKGDLIKELKAEAKSADAVFLATDPDREGEAISWHLANVLGIPEDKIKRVKFNEITKPCVKEAIKHSGKIDMNLVDAQQARRILDRIVGYKLSPVLWKNVKSGLSAGRVQSVATRLIVDRENEIRAFKPKEYWSVDITLKTNSGKTFSAYYFGDSDGKKELGSKADADSVLEEIKKHGITVKSIKKAERTKNPAPPFITSTLQQEAYRRLGFPSAKTMKTAQELYEGVALGEHGTHGIISYMRTDSLRISDIAADAAKQYITETYGESFYPKTRRIYKSRNGAQDAHEAIRPSYIEYPPKAIRSYLSNDQYKLYKLIWDRFISSQMASAVLDTVNIDSEAGNSIFRSSGYTVKFPGFMSVYEESTDDAQNSDSKEKDGLLPNVSEGEKLEIAETAPAQHFTQPPARYNEASLIKTLEEKGIGRPSTYTPTITTIVQRGYVERVAKTLSPTVLGELTTSLMTDNFPDVVDYNFTATMENSLDEIEDGKKHMLDVLKEFYDDFASELSKAEKTVEQKNYKLPVIETDIVCEKCGSKMVVKSGRFGKFAACPNYPACKNTKPLDKDGNAVETKDDTANAPQPAPDDIKCDICGSPMVIRRGRYGMFYACSNYPKCSGTKPINKELDVPCPLCGSKIVMRRGKNRTAFYSCSSYPKCKFTSCDTPTNEKCPVCGGMLLKKRGKNMYVCINKECSYKAEIPESESKEDN